MKIRLLETGFLVDALLDETHETACYFNAETDDFNTITREHFEVLDEADEADEVDEMQSTAELPTGETQPMLTLANVLGGRLKSLTVEFK